MLKKLLIVSLLIVCGLGLSSAILFILGTVGLAEIVLVIATVGGFLITLTHQYIISRED